MVGLRSLMRGTGALRLFLVLLLAACDAREPEQFAFQQAGATMGTTFSVKAPKLPAGLDEAALREKILATLEEVNGTMSTYQSDSELSMLNRNRSTGWIEISDALATVLDEALRVSVLSGGAYDVTVGPLVNLWGFGPEKREAGVPDPAEIQARMKICGYEKLHLNADKTAVRKDDPDLYIDLSSLAKGYGVDRVAELLIASGVGDFLVEIGGELRVKGSKAQEVPWKIAIEKPVPGERSIEEIIALKDVAVATSGDYRNFFEREGIRYSHTIDPKTGMPVGHDLASVTVLSDSTMRADAFATALLVLGQDAGFKLAMEQNLAVLFIRRAGEGFATLSTPSFPSEAE
ncbi:MAG: FAD:protein FMN transferase [Gammaproteobacteria bacterium]